MLLLRLAVAGILCALGMAIAGPRDTSVIHPTSRGSPETPFLMHNTSIVRPWRRGPPPLPLPAPSPPIAPSSPPPPSLWERLANVVRVVATNVLPVIREVLTKATTTTNNNNNTSSPSPSSSSSSRPLVDPSSALASASASAASPAQRYTVVGVLQREQRQPSFLEILARWWSGSGSGTKGRSSRAQLHTLWDLAAVGGFFFSRLFLPDVLREQHE